MAVDALLWFCAERVSCICVLTYLGFNMRHPRCSDFDGSPAPTVRLLLDGLGPRAGCHHVSRTALLFGGFGFRKNPGSGCVSFLIPRGVSVTAADTAIPHDLIVVWALPLSLSLALALSLFLPPPSLSVSLFVLQSTSQPSRRDRRGAL